MAREVAPRTDKPIVAVDLGGGRSWSAAVAVWQSGRIEAMAVAPGIPSLADQERRDSVPSGMYTKLYDAGILDMADGLRVQKPEQLWDAIVERWGIPVRVICDRFRLDELRDVIGGSCVMEPRVVRWSEAAGTFGRLGRYSETGQHPSRTPLGLYSWPACRRLTSRATTKAILGCRSAGRTTRRGMT